ncbi:MAG TPA: hypothetical protein VFB81_20950, partial [Myxococcales bacterium]|nr:hypothetical protein [Myxococcales bacterium]
DHGVAHYQTRQEVTPKDGKAQVTTIDERARIKPGGQEEPLKTTIKGQGHTVEITEDEKGRHYTDTNDRTGKVVHGNVRKVDGGIQVEINGKKLQLGTDGGFKDKDKLKGLSPDEFSAMPFLVTGARGVKGLVDSFGKDAAEAEKKVADALKDTGGVDKFRAAGAFFGTAASAKKVLDDIRNGDVLQAALDGTRGGVQGAQLGGSLLGKFEAASKAGKALGVVGGAIDIGSGIYGVFKADNDYDKATAGLNIVEGGMGIALALTAASGPAAPFLFAGIVGIEIAKAVIGHSKSEYVPPVAAALR